MPDDEVVDRTDMLNDYRESLLEFDSMTTLCARLTTIAENQDDKDGVFVGTIHSAKGLEWDSVFTLGWEDEVMPQTIDKRPKVFEEERRIAYVAITRAKNFLMLTHVDRRNKRPREGIVTLDLLQKKRPVSGCATSIVELRLKIRRRC